MGGKDKCFSSFYLGQKTSHVVVRKGEIFNGNGGSSLRGTTWYHSISYFSKNKIPV